MSFFLKKRWVFVALNGLSVFIMSNFLCGDTLSSMAARNSSPAHIKMLYNGLDPQSLAQHLAFHELYPHTPEGEQALKDISILLCKSQTNYTNSADFIPSLSSFSDVLLSRSSVEAAIALINKQPDDQLPLLNEEQLNFIDRITSHLPHRQLKGHYVTCEEEVLVLPPEEIDLARGLLLSEELQDKSIEANGKGKMARILSYEAALDMMALQILTKVSLRSTNEEKIRAISAFIFEDMGFRFPPHSQYAKDIDLYTFLPSVLDSRRGVCLGVSILYLSLAQRLGLPLEIVTPPGHIYVRYRGGREEINIETTARGIHVPSEEYLGMDNRSLQIRNIKEVIGMAHFNQASTFWGEEQYQKAVESYQKAMKYLPNDMLLKEFLGFSHLWNGNILEGIIYLRQVQDHLPEYAITKQTMVEDLLNEKVDVEGLKTIFMQVDESRDSILTKRDALLALSKRCPQFRAGLFHLAVSWLQLERCGEALEVLEKYHSLHPCDPVAEYYLTVLYAERLHYNKAWEHLRQTEKITSNRNHYPKTLKKLRKALILRCPE